MNYRKLEKVTLLGSFYKINVLGTPIDPGTPLNVISAGIDNTTKDVVVFEVTLLDVGAYFYNKSKRKIATKTNKCQSLTKESI
jgi:hypothetical protein